MAAFWSCQVKRKDCEDAEEQAGDDIDGVVEHAIDGSNGEEQARQPVKDSELFKMFAPPPRHKKRNRDVGTWKGRAGRLPLCP